MAQGDALVKEPSDLIWSQMAKRLGCDEATIRAVFEVEASGDFFDRAGNVIQRFEPHHFPKKDWPAIGFAPGNKAPWRASLAIRTSTRTRMFEAAKAINLENALKAASHGAPQIMGFNHRLAGFKSAKAMVDAFAESADVQIVAFVAFVEASKLATHLRAQDWLAFASGYNGDGQAPVYARKIETAYRRQTKGVPSATVLRLGSHGEAVKQLQEALAQLGYKVTPDGSFGQQTFDAVKAFQNSHGLKDDGVVGAVTQRALEAAGTKKIEAPKAEQSPTSNDALVDKVIERGTAVVGTGGLAGLLGALDDTAQQILIGGAVVGGLVVVTLFFLRRRNA